MDDESEFRETKEEEHWFDRRKQPLGRRTSDLYRFQIAPHTWGDISSIIMVMMIGIAAIGWFLKLENKIDQMANSQVELKIAIGKGILPITEERLKALDEKFVNLQQSIRDHRVNP